MFSVYGLRVKSNDLKEWNDQIYAGISKEVNIKIRWVEMHNYRGFKCS